MKIARINSVLLICLFFSVTSFSQVSNDDCEFAMFLPSTESYCSNDAEFTNLGATADPVFPHSCISPKFANGVWFAFVAKQPAISVSITTGGSAGSMLGPKILLFEECKKFVECSPGKTNNNDEFLYNNLILGKVYYLMIESNIGGEGSFRLCLENFTSVKNPESDCNKAVILCDKSAFVVKSLTGAGNNTKELETTGCLMTEFQSSWYKWTCDKSGTLSFTLTPNNDTGNKNKDITDDLDFAVYELPGGIDDCNNKKPLRCVASGANTTASGSLAPLAQWSRCNGTTGLAENDPDLTEPAGCAIASQNNFAKALDMVTGKSYVLIVNNFSKSGLGFSIEFGGSGTFLGPEVDYQITTLDRFECDKTVTFTNKSKSETDPVTSYKWNFGDGADPSFSSEFGPLDINYLSFGQKTTALTVTTSRGCEVTKILDLFVNACCKDTSTLAVIGTVQNLPCFGYNEGVIRGQGINGSPKYSYSIDSINFQPNPKFLNLTAGNYTLYIRDIKGCTNKIPLIITEPPQVIADAGPDIEVELGSKGTLTGSYIPGTGDGTPLWSPTDSIDNVDAFVTDLLPLKSKTYTLLVTDENGCTDTDEVEVRVRIIRPVFSPNVIQSGNPGTNGIFKLEGGRAVKSVKRLEVYDRWGNKLYKGQDLDIHNLDEGWNGTFNGKKVNPGVYTWIAIVLFLDDVEIAFSGDVTVVE